jgi:hypothetical protein
MTKEEAIHCLEIGRKVTHDWFVADEYLYMEDGIIYTEDGYPVTPEWWKLRSNSSWETGWKLYLRD